MQLLLKEPLTDRYFYFLAIGTEGQFRVVAEQSQGVSRQLLRLAAKKHETISLAAGRTTIARALRVTSSRRRRET